jgi:hypothetical protein
MSNREQLFTQTTAVAEASMSGEFDRSPLEGYVIEQMPVDLRAVSEGHMTHAELAAKQAELLVELAPQISANSDPRVARVTHLDLHFMLGGYIPTGEERRIAPPALTALIGEQCDRFADLEPHMTYEAIVDINSQEYERTGNMRVYSDGDDGKNERDFYLGHHFAEPFARQAAYQLHNLALSPGAYNHTAVLESVRANLNEFKQYMGRYAKLSKESFGYFRQFLGGYSDGTRNASGAFMPSVQLLELAMTPPTEMYGVYLDESQRYFPTWSKPVMAEWREQSERGINIEDRLLTGALELNPSAKQSLMAIVDEFIGFRMAHLGITKAQIPEAFSSLSNLTRKDVRQQGSEGQILEPEHKGTAGFDVRNVLTNSAYRLLMLRERLAGSVGSEQV